MKYSVKMIEEKINKKDKSHISRQMLSELLKKYYNIDNYELYNNKYGKPFIKDKSIFFSISYSFHYVVCIVDDVEIGIDIEKIRNTNINTINIFSTKKEKEYILKYDNYKRLFEIFTLKEAYFKMLGTDLKRMRDVEFSINDDNIICSDNSVDCKIIYYNEYIISIVKKISN